MAKEGWGGVQGERGREDGPGAGIAKISTSMCVIISSGMMGVALRSPSRRRRGKVRGKDILAGMHRAEGPSGYGNVESSRRSETVVDHDRVF